MPRPAPTPGTALGSALQTQRGKRSSTEIAQEVGLAHTTLLRLEKGTHMPTYATAKVIAKWLGWTTDQVMEAAEQPVP